VLHEGVRRIARGDYRARVAVNTKDEIGELAQAFNQMAADVEKHQRAAIEQERIKRELELGRRIQNEMLPRGPLLLGPTEIRGVSVPAREVGGDSFTYFELPIGSVALLVGDVSGKGVGAALLFLYTDGCVKAENETDEMFELFDDATMMTVRVG
jgi:sigma-B regulation protein RsbU (phosphoserine phosphatase)